MKVFAFDLRAAGSSAYRDAVIDLAGVHMEDGELVDSFHTYLGLNDWLSYRPSLLRDSHVSFKALQGAAPYHDGVGDFCAWLEEARGPLPVWGFEAKDKAAFVQSSLKYSKAPHGFDRIADVGSLFGVLSAVGATSPGPTQWEHVLHRLEIEIPSPRVDALERAKLTATAVALLEDELRRFYTVPSLELPDALPDASAEFDPFEDDPTPVTQHAFGFVPSRWPGAQEFADVRTEDQVKKARAQAKDRRVEGEMFAELRETLFQTLGIDYEANKGCTSLWIDFLVGATDASLSAAVEATHKRLGQGALVV